MEKQIHDFVVKCEKKRIFATELFDMMISYIICHVLFRNSLNVAI